VSADEPMQASVSADEPTRAMPVVGNARAGEESVRDEEDFRFSFDDDRN
jgi:hypothetical protein